MINFATSQGVSIPEGRVTQIADASGRILWRAKPVILQVEKIVSDTYAGETTYTGEEFILLDIYPKTNGTVKVTYGGLTKTITDTSGADEPNAQQVFFGTFNGMSDSVTTPASGELVIEGAYENFACGGYIKDSKGISSYCGCITAVNDWGLVKNPVFSAFYGCTGLTSITLPSEVSDIGNYVFYGCTGLTSITIPSGVTSIGHSAFYGCTGLTSIIFNEGLKTIGQYAFLMNTSDNSKIALYKGTITFPSTLESIGDSAFRSDDYQSSGDTFYYTYIGTAIMLSQTPPILGENAFGHGGYYDYDNKMLFIVPKGCVEAYQTYSSYIYSNIVEAS